MKIQIDQSVVAILKGDNILGTGFVVSSHHIITCAHVLESGNCGPGDVIKIRFEYNRDTVNFAEADTSYWRPGGRDICILSLTNPLPENVKPLTFYIAADLQGLPFQSFGYPNLGTFEGTWATGLVKGLIRDNEGNSFLQISSSDLAKGMSGAPICEVHTNHVIGVLSFVYHPDKSLKHRDTAFAISVDDIYKLYGELIQISGCNSNTIPNNLLFHNDVFVNRCKEKKSCITRLQRYRQVVISGLGGCGKSSLALEVARELINTSSVDAILWVDLKYHSATIDDLINKFARLLGYSVLLSMDGEKKQSLAQQLLSNLNILFIADNFSGKNQNLLNWFANLPSKCMVLYTSRENIQNSKIYAVNLKGLSKKYSRDLINCEVKRLDRTDLSKFSLTLVNSVYPYTQGLPLAIKWIISELGLSNAELSRVLTRLRIGDADIFYELFHAIFNQLSLPSKHILLSLSTYKSPVSSAILAYVLNDKNVELDNAIAELSNFNLLEVNVINLKKVSYSLHPITLSFANSLVSNNKELLFGIMKRNSEFLIGIVKSYAGQDNWDGFFIIDEWYSNIKEIIEWNYENKEFAEVIQCGISLEFYLWARGYWSYRAKLGQMILEIARIKKDNLLEVWVIATIIADGYLLIGDYIKAKDLLNEVLDKVETMGDQQEIAFCLYQKSRVLRKLKEFDGARSAAQQSVNIYTTLNDERGLGYASNGYANTLYDKDNFDSAEQWYSKSLEIWNKREENMMQGVVLRNLARMALSRKNLENSRNYYQRALIAFEKTGVQMELAQTRQGLAQINIELGYKDEAVLMLKDAIDKFSNLGAVNEAEEARLLLSQLL